MAEMDNADSVNTDHSGVSFADSDCYNETERILAELFIPLVLLCVLLSVTLWLNEFYFYHKEAQALRNSLAGYFSEGARLPRWRVSQRFTKDFLTDFHTYIKKF